MVLPALPVGPTRLGDGRVEDEGIELEDGRRIGVEEIDELSGSEARELLKVCSVRKTSSEKGSRLIAFFISTSFRSVFGQSTSSNFLFSIILSYLPSSASISSFLSTNHINNNLPNPSSPWPRLAFNSSHTPLQPPYSLHRRTASCAWR